MVLEVVVGLAGIAFIYAYLYANSPKENTWFKILFLFLSLFTIIILTWSIVYGQSVTYNYFYDAGTATLFLNGTENTTISDNMQPLLSTYFTGNMWVVITLLFIIVILFLVSLFSEFTKKKQEKGL